MNKAKVIKVVEINGVKVRIGLSEEDAKRFPEKIESSLRIRDKKLAHISANSVFL